MWHQSSALPWRNTGRMCEWGLLGAAHIRSSHSVFIGFSKGFLIGPFFSRSSMNLPSCFIRNIVMFRNKFMLKLQLSSRLNKSSEFLKKMKNVLGAKSLSISLYSYHRCYDVLILIWLYFLYTKHHSSQVALLEHYPEKSHPWETGIILPPSILLFLHESSDVGSVCGPLELFFWMIGVATSQKIQLLLYSILSWLFSVWKLLIIICAWSTYWKEPKILYSLTFNLS